MTTTLYQNSTGRTSRIHRTDKPVEWGRLSKWAAFLTCCFLVWIFMFVAAPRLTDISLIGRLAGFIEDSGIDAGALFYTEVEETAHAEIHARSIMEYPPAGP